VWRAREPPSGSPPACPRSRAASRNGGRTSTHATCACSSSITSTRDRATIVRQLESWNLRPTEAAEGFTALALLSREARQDSSARRRQVVILDAELPDITPDEFARRARQCRRVGTIAVLMLLCDAEQAPEVTQAQLRGFSGVITSPVRQSTLFDQIVDSLADKAPAAPAPQPTFQAGGGRCGAAKRGTPAAGGRQRGQPDGRGRGAAQRRFFR
jgi:CheY-like chemotaxis protein